MHIYFLTVKPTFNVDQEFAVKSIKNDTNYVVLISGSKALVSFFGSVENTGLNDNDVSVVGVTQIQKGKGRGRKNKHKKRSNDYFITMIVFIVLFSIMLIGSLILYFTGMMKFHSFGHGTHY